MSHPDVKREVEFGETTAVVSSGRSNYTVRTEFEDPVELPPDLQSKLNRLLGRRGTPVVNQIEHPRGGIVAMVFGFRCSAVNGKTPLELVVETLRELHQEFEQTHSVAPRRQVYAL